MKSLTEESGAVVCAVSDEHRAAFGEFFASARQRAGRSLEEIAGSTRISVRYLDALDHGRVEILPGGIYRRAIVRNYAAAIGLDPRGALERFDRTFGVPVPPERLEPDAAARASRLAIPSGSAAMTSRVLEAATVIVVVIVTAHFIARRTTAGSPPVSNAAPIEALPSLPPTLKPGTGTSGNALSQPDDIADGRMTAVPLTEAQDESSAGDPAESERRLAITSDPAGARVTVNGIAWGVTPITIRHLSPGVKVIRVTKDGYVGRERRVDLGTDTGPASVRLTLEPRD